VTGFCWSLVAMAQIVLLFTSLQKYKQKGKKFFEVANQRIICTIYYLHKLQSDQILKKYCCQISQQIPLIPVLDKEGHRFDYAMIKNHTIKAIECPPESQDLHFDLEAFIVIQKRLKFLKDTHLPLVKNISYSIFNLSRNLP
jgi:hypothetical protein